MTAPLATGKGPRLEKEAMLGATASYVAYPTSMVPEGAVADEM
jgi:hypothetical protein